MSERMAGFLAAICAIIMIVCALSIVVGYLTMDRQPLGYILLVLSVWAFWPSR